VHLEVAPSSVHDFIVMADSSQHGEKGFDHHAFILNTKTIGIRLTCKSENRIESYEIIGKPASMSQDEAQYWFITNLLHK